MNITIQASDLDASRIDGTRIYIWNLLKKFGQLNKRDTFFIYHRKNFNPELTPPDFSNYKIIRKDFPFLWTQTRFAWENWKKNSDLLWMPMQTLPFLRKKKQKTIVTIHDLAFKYFPKHFTRKDLRRLNLFSDFAIKKSTKIIAVSHSTKKDILKFFPKINPEKIKVIHHGFDPNLFQKDISSEKMKAFQVKHNLANDNYLLYVGALQPRKNLVHLIEAFEKIKENYPSMKLVLIGEKAWLWKEIFDKIKSSPFRKDIILPGKVSFKKLTYFYQGASIFIFPSLYEGFGLPILEAQASGVPVITSNNSSLPEVAGEGGVLINPLDSSEIANAILKIESDQAFKKDLISKGFENLDNFSWDKCAKETLEFFKS